MTPAESPQTPAFRKLTPYACKRLLAARLQLNLTQAQVAAMAGVSRSTVSDLERGKRLNIGLDHVEAIAHALGMTLITLLSLAEQDSQHPPSISYTVVAKTTPSVV